MPATPPLGSPEWHREILDEREHLIASGGAHFSDWEQAKIDVLWAIEAERRLAEVRAGRAQTISGEEAAARVRRAVDQ